MVYFYGKLNSRFKQIKIDPNKAGKNIEIKFQYTVMGFLDFGFEGYNPIDLLGFPTYKSGSFYFENIYEKLKPKLVEGEYLYLYVVSNLEPEINYFGSNLDNPNNEYNFLVVQNNTFNNEEEKSLIINNRYMTQIQYQIKYCKSPHSVKLHYQESPTTEEKLYEFYNDTEIIKHSINQNPFKLRFESTEDFVFIYSYIDKADLEFYSNQKWNDERKELTELSIKEVNINKNENNKCTNILSIKFYPNYKNSSTKYIIVITPKENNTDNETFSNPCYITKLLTEKAEGIKILEFADTGENDFISIEADFSDISSESDEYIINIISQELRFNKRINYYLPYELAYKKCIPKDDDDNNDNGFPMIYIILISIGGVLILLIIIFFILRCCKKKNDIDYIQETKTMKNEELLNE